MATRKIIDIEQNGEKVWPKGHAKATFMSNGTTVEDAINSIQTGAGGGVVSETDPIFSASPAASITEAKKTEWDNKVDKVSGKQLSTEDFTTALKTKLEGLSNYDDEEIQSALSSLQTQFNTLVSGNASDAINSFNEIIAFLDGVKDTEDLSSIIASIEQQIAGKMDKVTLATVATSGSYDDLSNKPNIPSAVTESTVSGWGFTKNAGTYSKPSTGIPKSDLASAVQTSLGKADTALQSYTEQYKGTVTKVKINGSEKAPDSNGVVDLGTIEGGGSSSDGAKEYVKVEVSNGSIDFLGNADKPSFEPNKIYYATESVSEAVTISSVIPPTGDVGEYTLYFDTMGNITVFFGLLDLPSEWIWANGEIPTLEEGVSYELSVVATKSGNDYIYKAVLTPFRQVE